MSEYKSLLKDSGIFAIGTFGSRLITLLFVPLYTACLSTAEYGTADLVTMTVSLLFPIFTLSISEAILRFCYQKDVNKYSIINIFYVTIIIATVLNILLSFIACLFIPSIKPYLIYYIILFTLAALETGLANYLKGCQKIKQFAIQGIIHTGVIVLSNLLLLLVFNMGLDGYFISMIAAYATTILYMFFAGNLFSYHFSFHLDKPLLLDMLRYSLPLVPAGMAWWINISADKYMISGMLSIDDVGIYSVAHKIPTILTTVTGLFLSAWQLSAIKNVNSPEYRALFSNIVKSVNCLLVVGGAFLILSCQVLSKFLFQKNFYIAWEVVPLLTVAACFSTIAGILASAFTAAKKTNVLFVSTVAGAIINIISNYVLIRIMGTIGAAIATCLSFFTMVFVRFLMMSRKLVRLDVDVLKDSISFALLFTESILIYYFNEWFYILSSLFALILLFFYYKDMLWITKSITRMLYKKFKFRK